MECQINWTKRAWLTYEANLNYLEAEWTQKEISNFIYLVEKKLAILSKNPRLGISRNKMHPDIRCTVVHKRVLLIYKYFPRKREIALLVFWNTYQNPKKLRLK